MNNMIIIKQFEWTLKDKSRSTSHYIIIVAPKLDFLKPEVLYCTSGQDLKLKISNSDSLGHFMVQKVVPSMHFDKPEVSKCTSGCYRKLKL